MPILVSAIQVSLLLFVYPFETPCFLKQTGDTQALKSALTKIYKTPERANMENDNIVILNEDDQQNLSIFTVVYDPRYRRATLVGCMLIAIHQLSGLGAILTYSNLEFQGLSLSNNLVTELITIVNLGSIIIGLALLSVFGRRTLLLWFSLAQGIALFSLAYFTL